MTRPGLPAWSPADIIVRVRQRLSSQAFVGRETERAQLSRALAAAADGRPAAILIGGEAGVGKTRLIETLIGTAEQEGWRVLVGHCFELGESGLPFAPIVEALRELGRDLGLEELLAILGPGRDEIGRLVPDLVATADPFGAPSEPREGTQARLFEHVLGALGRLAERGPLLLVVEDLHWADRSTRDLWRYLARNLRRERLVLLGTFRTDELHRRHPLLRFLAALERVDRVSRIDLERFDLAEVTAQLAGILGRPPPGALARRIYDRSDGNAFFVEELVAADSAGGADAPGSPHALGSLPLSLEAVLTERVMRLSEATQRVLRVAAAVGREVDHGLLGYVSDEAEATLLEALHEAVAQHVLVASAPDAGSSYRFRHALVQEAVYAELLPAERTTLHGRIAETLLADPTLGSGTRAGLAAELAHHALLGHDLRLGFHWSVEAGRAATDVSAFAEAHRHFERAIELWPRIQDPQAGAEMDHPELLARAAETAAASGELARAAALVRAALDALDPAGETDRRVQFHDRLFWFLFESGDLEAAGRSLEDAPSEPVAAPALRARILDDLANLRTFQARYAEAETWAIEALALAREAGSPREEGRALRALGVAQASLGDLEGAIAHLEEAHLALAAADDDLQTMAVQSLALALYWAGYHTRSIEVLSLELERVGREGTERRHAPGIVSSLWDSLTDLGRWHEADELLGRVAWPDEETRATAWLRECIAELAVLRGDIGRARHEVALAEQTIGPGSSTLDRVFVLRSLAAIARAEERFDDVRLAVDEAIAQSHDAERDAPLWWLFALAARSEADRAVIARAKRRGEEMADAGVYARRMSQILDRIDAAARAAGRPVATLAAYAAHARAELARLEDRPDPVAWLTTADLWAELAQPLDAGYARFRAAEAMLEAGNDRRAAAKLLAGAHQTAMRLGAAPLLGDTEALARRARIALEVHEAVPGGPGKEAPSAAPPDRSRDPYGLTRREREVLAMLAEGRTNREIGDALFITEKTASVHVSNILGKLGVPGRGAAAAVAVRIGLVGAGPGEGTA